VSLVWPDAALRPRPNGRLLPTPINRAFQFLLATAMHEAGKFELLNVAEVEGRWHYTFSGAGEVFSVVRPEMDKGYGEKSE